MPTKESIPVRTAQSRGHKVLIAGLVLLCVGLTGALGWIYTGYRNLQAQASKSTELQTSTLLKQVAGVIDLPHGETPTIATVQDKTKLKDQPFFAAAQNSDKLIIYATAKKAIIYRPSTHKIINVGPIAIDAKK